jgi:SAM-dependent methyltransferase
MTDQSATAHPPAPISADDEGLWAKVPTGIPLDVLVEGRRVWSVTASPLEAEDDGTVLIPWPDPVRRFLDGDADVEIRAHDSIVPLARAELSFGSGQGRVELIDQHGRALTLHKWGKLGQTFEDVGEQDKQAYLDQVAEVLRVLQDLCEVPAFLSFGTLLGAVRDGRLIGHDVDVDLGYLSSHAVPVDVIVESFAIERVLAAETGWRITRANGGFLQLFPPQPDGRSRNIDVFSCFCTDSGGLYQINDIGTTGDRSVILPLQQIPLEGRLLPAPAKPEVLLEAAYGSGWRVPDPTFRYTGNPTRRRIKMWVGGLREDRDHWSRFYRDNLAAVPLSPTPFASWVLGRAGEGMIIDVGCGNGRDVMYYARSGRQAIGLDVVSAAFRRARRRARRRGLPARFQALNLSSLRETLMTGAQLAHLPGPRTVVARFLLHNLAADSRDHFWRMCAMALSEGGRCLVEFRSPADESLPKHFEHAAGPRSLDPALAVAEAARHGAVEVERLEGRGLAPFEEEDPVVCRLVLKWGGEPVTTTVEGEKQG